MFKKLWNLISSAKSQNVLLQINLIFILNKKSIKISGHLSSEPPSGSQYFAKSGDQRLVKYSKGHVVLRVGACHCKLQPCLVLSS